MTASLSQGARQLLGALARLHTVGLNIEATAFSLGAVDELVDAGLALKGPHGRLYITLDGATAVLNPGRTSPHGP